MDRSSVSKVQGIHANVDTLKPSIRGSKDGFSYKALKPPATGLVKNQI